jgi:hypothetical protein
MVRTLKATLCAAVQIDLRYGNRDEGSLEVVVAPVLRFLDVGYNANVTIEEIGPPSVRREHTFIPCIFFLILGFTACDAGLGWRHCRPPPSQE